MTNLWRPNICRWFKIFTAVNDPAIKALPRFASAATRPGAIVRQFAAPQDPTSLQVERRGANHSLALAANGYLPQPADLLFAFDQIAAEVFKAAQVIRKGEDPGSIFELDICPRTVEEHPGISRTKSSLWQGTTGRINLLATEEVLEVAA
ncbi:MAG: hypothetical protein ABR577_18655 [Pyrinomonadaceae bacterium]